MQHQQWRSGLKVENAKVEGLNRLITEFATRIAHHENVTVFFSAHSVFYNSDMFRLLQRSPFVTIKRPT